MIGWLVRTLGLWPLPMLYALGAAIAFVAHRILRWHVPLAQANLARSLPELSDAQREAILDANYRTMGQTLAESIWGWRRGGAALADRVVIDNREVVERYAAMRQSVVLLTAHIGNWEWLLMAAGAQLGVPIDAIYKRVSVPSMDRYLRQARSRDGGRPIELGELLPELMIRAGEPRGYGMLADQTPPRDSPKHWVRFLHQDTAFFAGIGSVARFLEAPVVYVAMRRVRRGRYVAHVHVLCEPPYESDPELAIVERYAQRLEAEVRANPADWLWVHRKWKYPKPAGEEAPAAATRAARRHRADEGRESAT